MKVWGVTESEVRECARSVGVAIHSDWNGNGITQVGRAQQFRLALGDDKQLYRRLSASPLHRERKVNAVCWHGHRDFMRAIFRVNPEARIKSAFADYRGSEDFEQSFPETGYRNIGSVMYPCEAQDACVCENEPRGIRERHGDGFTTYSLNPRQCPHYIMAPEHYRPDGTCKCDDPDDPHMAEWGYTWQYATSPTIGQWA